MAVASVLQTLHPLWVWSFSDDEVECCDVTEEPGDNVQGDAGNVTETRDEGDSNAAVTDADN